MKRRDSILLRAVSFFLVCFVIAYMGYHVTGALFRSPPETVGAVMFTVEDTVQVNGFFVRDEMLLPYPDGGADYGIAEAYVGDGARVAKDDIIYRIYGDQSALANGERLRALERRIADMEYVGDSVSGAVDAAHMDLLIFQRLADMLDSRDRRRSSALESGILDFKSLVFKREYAYGSGSGLSSALDMLYAQAEELRAQSSQEISVVRAPVSGAFTSQADGYELLVTPELLDELTVSDYIALGERRSVSDAGTSMGKLALGFEWYHVILLPWEDARLLKAGQALTLRFENEGRTEIKFKIRRISDPENEQAVVVLSSAHNIGEFINVRRMPADLVLHTYTGLRVPRNAIWYDDRHQSFGVYCMIGNQGTFKEVSILTERDNYYLVEFDPLTAKANDLLPGDEMIIEGKDIYDGKVYLQS